MFRTWFFFEKILFEKKSQTHLLCLVNCKYTSSQECLCKISTRGVLLSVKTSLLLNAYNPQLLNRVKLNNSNFSHLQYVLQRLLQAYFRFQNISLNQAWATYGPRNQFMRPADTYRNMNTERYRESNRRLVYRIKALAW